MANTQYHLRIHPAQYASGPAARAGPKAGVVLALQGARDVPLNVAVVWSQGERIAE